MGQYCSVFAKIIVVKGFSIECEIFTIPNCSYVANRQESRAFP